MMPRRSSPCHGCGAAHSWRRGCRAAHPCSLWWHRRRQPLAHLLGHQHHAGVGGGAEDTAHSGALLHRLQAVHWGGRAVRAVGQRQLPALPPQWRQGRTREAISQKDDKRVARANVHRVLRCRRRTRASEPAGPREAGSGARRHRRSRCAALQHSAPGALGSHLLGEGCQRLVVTIEANLQPGGQAAGRSVPRAWQLLWPQPGRQRRGATRPAGAPAQPAPCGLQRPRKRRCRI